jgi:anhydro-N-acetylmuramic acid kinase
MMDAFMRTQYNKPYDEGGKVALQGKVNNALLAIMKQDSFFEVGLPKTIGPELFNIHFIETAKQKAGLMDISEPDVMATLNRLSAETIVEAIQQHVPYTDKYTIYTSGGGMHNPVLIQHLQQLLPHIQIESSDKIGIHPDAKEAILFAVLANEAVAGAPMYAGGNATKIPITMGKISFPN